MGRRPPLDGGAGTLALRRDLTDRLSHHWGTEQLRRLVAGGVEYHLEAAFLVELDVRIRL